MGYHTAISNTSDMLAVTEDNNTAGLTIKYSKPNDG